MHFLSLSLAAATLLGCSSAAPGGPSRHGSHGSGSHQSHESEQRDIDGEVPYVRSFFYAGGGYVDDGSGGHIYRDQMYVEKLVPVDGATQSVPIVLIHGQAQTGTVGLTFFSPQTAHVAYTL